MISCTMRSASSPLAAIAGTPYPDSASLCRRLNATTRPPSTIMILASMFTTLQLRGNRSVKRTGFNLRASARPTFQGSCQAGDKPPILREMLDHPSPINGCLFAGAHMANRSWHLRGNADVMGPAIRGSLRASPCGSSVMFAVSDSIHPEMFGHEGRQRVAIPIEPCGKSTLIFQF